MDQIMSEVFKAKVRKIGNSYGILIPAEVLDEIQVGSGDEINVSISNDNLEERNRKLRGLAGVYTGNPSFIREKEDRF
jgi:antitoxin component of MazEF toxin-antitoxin module